MYLITGTKLIKSGARNFVIIYIYIYIYIYYEIDVKDEL